MRGRGEEIWDYAKVHGWVTGEIPSDGRVIWNTSCRAVRRSSSSIFAAMDYRALPAFVAYLRKEETPARLVLEFPDFDGGKVNKKCGRPGGGRSTSRRRFGRYLPIA